MYNLKAKVENNEVSITEQTIDLTENSLNVIQIDFTMPDEFDSLTTIAVFTVNDTAYKKTIIDNSVIIPENALVANTRMTLGVYAYSGEELMYSPKPIGISVYGGSYVEESESEKAFTITEYDTYMEKAKAMYTSIETLTDTEIEKINTLVVDSKAEIETAKENAITAVKEQETESKQAVVDTLKTIRIDETNGKMYVTIG